MPTSPGAGHEHSGTSLSSVISDSNVDLGLVTAPTTEVPPSLPSIRFPPEADVQSPTLFLPRPWERAVRINTTLRGASHTGHPRPVARCSSLPRMPGDTGVMSASTLPWRGPGFIRILPLPGSKVGSTSGRKVPTQGRNDAPPPH